jgi:hypothetical protein
MPSLCGRSSRSLRVAVAWVCLLVPHSGCSSEHRLHERAWEEAERTNDLGSYERFLLDHGESAFAERARDRISELTRKDWELTTQKNTIEEYAKFYDRHASNARARDRAMSAIFALTESANTIASYEAFLDRKGTEPYHLRVLEGIWKLVEAENQIDTYDRFVKVYGDTPFAARASTLADALWKSATTKVADCGVTNDMTVLVQWSRVPGATAYALEASPHRGFPESATRLKTVVATSSEERDRVGTYGARLPMYYRVSAIRKGKRTKASETCVARLPPSDGSTCQICGNRPAGYCHLRAIHVCEHHAKFTDDGGTKWRCP